MNFDFTEEQNALRDALNRQLERSYGFEKRKQIVASPEGTSSKVWQQLAELGALAVAMPEAHGGMGGGAVDTLVVLEALGRKLVVEPFIPTVVLGACDSGVPNRVFTNGCTMSDVLARCKTGAANHGAYVSCVTQATSTFRDIGATDGKGKGAIQSCAAKNK